MSETNEFLSYAANKWAASESKNSEMESETIEQKPIESQPVPEMGASEATVSTQEGSEAPAQQAEPTTPEPTAQEGGANEPKAPSIEDYLAQQTQGTADAEKPTGATDETEALKARIKELESNQVTFASDWMKTLNEMHLKGASKEQVQSFLKINQIGNLDEMNPFDTKVSKLVLIDGFSEKSARALVNRDFNIEAKIEEFGEDSEEVELLKEELRISSSNDLKELNSYRHELTVVENKEAKQAQEAELAAQAQQAQFVKFVDQEAPKISTFFPKTDAHKLRVGGEKGVEIDLDFKYEQEFLEKQLPSYVRNSLTEAGETTQASIKEAFEYAQAVYWSNPDNRAKLVKSAAEKGYNAGLEAKDKEYANISGLPRHTTPVQRTIPTEQRSAFLSRVANG